MDGNKWLPLGTDKDGVREDIQFDWTGDGGWSIGQAMIRRTFEGVSNPFHVIEQNKQWDGDGYTPSRDLQHVASIPLWVVEKWIETYGVDPTREGHKHLLSRLLNDPDWRWLRTGGGTLKFKER